MLPGLVLLASLSVAQTDPRPVQPSSSQIEPAFPTGAVAPEGNLAAPSSPTTQNGTAQANGSSPADATSEEPGGLFRRFIKAYCDEFKPTNGNKNGDQAEEAPVPPRRALPSPWSSPPFPNSEYQGFPLVGVPPSDTVYPLMKAVYGGPFGEEIKESRIKAYGWINASGNWSTSRNSNTILSYWVDPNRLVLDQAVLRLEREVDTVQTDHVDWGFRITGDYGIDYRYFTAGGWFSD